MSFHDSPSSESLLWSRKWLILATAVVSAAVTLAVSLTLPNRYQSEALIMVVQPRSSDTVSTRFDDPFVAFTERVLSRTRLERLIEEFDLYAGDRQNNVIQNVVDRMQRDVVVRQDSPDTFLIGFLADDPATAKNVAERIMAQFIDESLRQRENLFSREYRLLEEQLEDARTRLIEHETQLRQWQSQHPDEALSLAMSIESQVLQDSYSSLLTSREEARMRLPRERRSDARRVEVLDPPRLPERPVGPSHTTVSTLGGVGGLGLGIVAALFGSRRKRHT